MLAKSHPGETAIASETVFDGAGAIVSARRTLALEIQGLAALNEAIDNGLGAPFARAVELIRSARGRVIVTGMGKSGHIGQKIAATLASTGTPAFFVHPGEASHGDLGMIARDDVIIALSWSGETVELGNILSYSRRFNVPLIAFTSREESALGRASDIVLRLPTSQEACPHGLAPTTSTAMQLVLGDCLAIALLEARGFSAADFKIFHPGGQLGANLRYVCDLMHKGDRVPLAAAGLKMAEALVTMTEKSFGCLGVTDADGKLVGIVTDGDLRRHMGPELLNSPVGEVMTQRPKVIPPTMLASAALAIMNSPERPVTALFVEEDGKPIGIIHIHDLLRAGVA
jgi:arabinose-5-phosphate isomerase